MKLFTNAKLTETIKHYKFNENSTPASANFSDEFEIKMGKLFRRKERSHNIRIFSQRAAAAVVTLALVGSLFYLLILPKSSDSINPLYSGQEAPDSENISDSGDIQYDDDNAVEERPLDMVFICECCSPCDPTECICNECGDNEDCACLEQESTELSIIYKDGDILVSTAEELVSVIYPGAIITLQAGLYDISTVVDFKNPYIKWQSDTYGLNEKTLVITGVDNLTLQAEPGAEVEIVTPYRFAEILAFENCNNINLIGIKAGHTITSEYACDAGVVSFNNSSNIFIDNCHFYGCGSVGITMMGCSNALIQNTIIDDCSRTALIIDNSHDIEFINCKFIDNRAYQFIIGIWSSTVNFTDCEISGNNGYLYESIIGIDSYHSGNSIVLFDRCIIVDNSPFIDHWYDEGVIRSNSGIVEVTGINPYDIGYIFKPVSDHHKFEGVVSIRDCVIELGLFLEYWKNDTVNDLGGNVLR